MRRVLTNGQLGLGDAPFKPGLGDVGDPFKPGLGDVGDPFKSGLGDVGDPFKSGLGDVGDPFKPGLGDVGDPFKSGLGDVGDPFKAGLGDVGDPFKPGLGVTANGVVATGAMLTVVDLFKLVALSLAGLERTVAALEQIVLGHNFGAYVPLDEARQRTADQAKRAFQGLRDQISGARTTALFVICHPTQGLGPGVGGPNGAGRQHLAAIGGLSARYLRLL